MEQIISIFFNIKQADICKNFKELMGLRSA